MPATLQHLVQIIDGKANVMNPRPAFGYETRDRGFFVLGLEQLDQRLSSTEADDACAVRVIQRRWPQAKDIAKEWKRLRKGLYCDSNVGNPRSARG